MTTPDMPEFPELGFYALAGHAPDPRAALHEIRHGEQLGMGAVFLSERFDTKDAGVLAGAATAISESIGIGTAATNPQTRHPMVTATMATTAHRLSGGRYALGLGRGFDALFDLMGLPRVSSARLEDTVEVLRTLFRGDAAIGHDGPAGAFPYLRRTADGTDRIPILMVALGDRSLELAGRIADGVVLHTFFSDATVARAVKIVRDAAAAAERDPASVRIWSVLATVEESIPHTERRRKLVGRLATYLQGYGDVLIKANGWSAADLERFRTDPIVQQHQGAFDATGTDDVLRHLEAQLPEHWLAASATGTSQRCAERIADQFDAGADSVILHGATPAELAPVLDAWRHIRAPHRFAHLPANPGWSTR